MKTLEPTYPYGLDVPFYVHAIPSQTPGTAPSESPSDASALPRASRSPVSGEGS